MPILIRYLELIYHPYIFLTKKVKCYNGQYQTYAWVVKRKTVYSYSFRQVPSVFIICKKKKKALEQRSFRVFKRQMEKE